MIIFQSHQPIWRVLYNSHAMCTDVSTKSCCLLWSCYGYLTPWSSGLFKSCKWIKFKKWSDSFLKYWLKKNKIEKISSSNFRYAAAPEFLVHSVSNNFRNKPFSNVHCLVKVSILHRKVLIFFVMIEWNV
jgi:hypothetical protein